MTTTELADPAAVPGFHECCRPADDHGVCICVGGTIDLTPLGDLYSAAVSRLGVSLAFPCPRCRPEEWPTGFPGLRAQPEDSLGHYLIEPTGG